MQLGIAFLFLVVMFSVARWGGEVRVPAVPHQGRRTVHHPVLRSGGAVRRDRRDHRCDGCDRRVPHRSSCSAPAPYRGRIERVAVPLRDVFGAFFFLNFGLGLERGRVPLGIIGPVAIAVVMTFVLNLASGMLLARLHQWASCRRSDQHGGHPRQPGRVHPDPGDPVGGRGPRPAGIQPFAGLYVLTMAILGPLFAVNSERIGSFVLGTKRKKAAALAAAAAAAATGAGGSGSGAGRSGRFDRRPVGRRGHRADGSGGRRRRRGRADRGAELAIRNQRIRKPPPTPVRSEADRLIEQAMQQSDGYDEYDEYDTKARDNEY